MSAQDHDRATPPADAGGGVIGSDVSTESTGGATPHLAVEETPFARYKLFLEPVEAGDKEFEVVAQDRIVTIAKDMRYAAWTFGGTVPGPALRVPG